MEESLVIKPPSEPISYGNKKIVGPDSMKKTSCLRAFYSSKKYNNLRAFQDSVDRLSALKNLSVKRPDYIVNHIGLTANAIASALCSTNPIVVEKSIENELRDSYWLFLNVAINNLCSNNQQILDESLQLIYDMHACFQPEYFITTIKEIIPTAKKSNKITSFLFCLFQLLQDRRENIKSYFPTYIELLLTMKKCYKPMRKVCHMIGKLFDEIFVSNELKILIETNLKNDEHNIRKFCKLYGLHSKDFTVSEIIHKKNNKKKENDKTDYRNDILPTLLKCMLKNDDINDYDDYYDSDINSVLSDTEKNEMIKDLLEESQEIVNKHEIRYKESLTDVLLDRESELSTDDNEFEFNEDSNNLNNNNNNNLKKKKMRCDSSDDERVNKRLSTGSLDKNDIDYGLLCSIDHDEMKVDTSLSLDGRRRPKSEKLLPISSDDHSSPLHHSKLNRVVKYIDLTPSTVEEASWEDENSKTPIAGNRTFSMINDEPAVKSPLIKELAKQSEDLLEKTGGKDYARKTSMYDELLYADRESYVESDISSEDACRVDEESQKPRFVKQLSMDEVNLRKDEENIPSILVEDSPVQQSQQPNADPTPIN